MALFVPDTVAADGARDVVDKLESEKGKLRKAHRDCWNNIGFIPKYFVSESPPQTPQFTAPELDALIEKETLEANEQDDLIIDACRETQSRILREFEAGPVTYINLTKDNLQEARNKRGRSMSFMSSLKKLDLNMYVTNTRTQKSCMISLVRNEDADTRIHSIQVQFDPVHGSAELTPEDKTHVRQMLRYLIDVMFTEILYTRENFDERHSMLTYFGSDGIFRNNDNSVGLNTLLQGRSPSDTMFGHYDRNPVDNPHISINMEAALKFFNARLLDLAEEIPTGELLHDEVRASAGAQDLLVRLRV